MTKKQEQQKEILNGCSNGIDYIAKRLNWDENAKISALKNWPSLAKTNVSKVRFILLLEFHSKCKLKLLFWLQIRNQLDFLLNETHFTETDIGTCLRVFMISYEELMARIDELSTVNYVPKRLYIVCLDRKRYLSTIEKHCQRINDEHVWQNFRTIEKRIKEK